MIRGLDEELVALKYSHVERERRFFVDPESCPRLAGLASILIEDLYIDGTRLRLRRMTASDTGRVVLKLTKKYAEGLRSARPMVTTYLTQLEYDLLGALPAHGLVKRRYPVGHFSLDVFEGKLSGLRLAESEQSDAAALVALLPPHWAVEDVSDDPRYEGASLALADRVPER